jgi:acetoacetyl-CoA synthetase
MHASSEILWTASPRSVQESGLVRFRTWVNRRYGLNLNTYEELYAWSIAEYERFWETIFQYFEIAHDGEYKYVCSSGDMPEVQWFEGIRLNYAEHIFRKKDSRRPAIIAMAENLSDREISWEELEGATASLQSFFDLSGLVQGDRVVAYASNVPETSMAMLAAVASGLIWSSCSPDFGVSGATDRFAQIDPGVLFASTAYSYSGKVFDRRSEVLELVGRIPGLKRIVWIEAYGVVAPVLEDPRFETFTSLIQRPGAFLRFVRVPFSHPIWILYSSGTTGLPKAMVHGHGGMLLEHLKYLVLHNDVRPGERFFWYTTTGWMMWNFVHASMLAGATAVLYDGSAAFPTLDHLWSMVGTNSIQHFGTSAPYLVACMKENLVPGRSHQLEALRSIGSTGSPLPPEAFSYVYQAVGNQVWLCSMSGGSDVCTAFVGGCIERPVRRGQIQCRTLGVDLEAWDEAGQAVWQTVGEMVIRKPLPCMPVYFWNDPGFAKYRASYFEQYPGIWRHGDWIEITAEDGLVIHGRSDTTLNRQGVRIGTAEIYQALDGIRDLQDALIVNLEWEDGEHFMPLFVRLRDQVKWSDALQQTIVQTLRRQCSPRHVPDLVVPVPDIPYTISGKKMEGPVKKILMGMDPLKSINSGTMRNPDSIQFFIENRKRIIERSNR